MCRATFADDGLALNPTRRGYLGQLVAHVSRLGIEAITGKPYKPTTQGKNERFHQTLFRYLDKQPLAETLAELQAQVDAFDHIYNTERPHQGLPGRITPLVAWEATPKADPPRPDAADPGSIGPSSAHLGVPDRSRPPTYLPTPASGRSAAPAPSTSTRSSTSSTSTTRSSWSSSSPTAIETGDKITITDLDGEILAEHARPALGITYVGDGRRPGLRPKNPGASPKS